MFYFFDKLEIKRRKIMLKKTILLCCFICLAGMVNLTSALDTPIAYYSMDEGSGTTVADASGNGNDGTIVGTLDWVEGAPGFGTGLDFPVAVDPTAGIKVLFPAGVGYHDLPANRVNRLHRSWPGP